MNKSNLSRRQNPRQVEYQRQLGLEVAKIIEKVGIELYNADPVLFDNVAKWNIKDRMLTNKRPKNHLQHLIKLDAIQDRGRMLSVLRMRRRFELVRDGSRAKPEDTTDITTDEEKWADVYLDLNYALFLSSKPPERCVFEEDEEVMS